MVIGHKTCNADMEMGWVNPWVGLSWVGLGWRGLNVNISLLCIENEIQQSLQLCECITYRQSVTITI